MSEVRLVVDPVSCTGIGICAHAAGRVVDLDAWGYPVVPPTALTGRDARAARAAAKACPRRALFLLPGGGPTNREQEHGPTDRPADGPTDRPMDGPSIRQAVPHR